MKKIITSAAVAAALTTGAFAVGSIQLTKPLNVTVDPITFNKNFISEDTNVSEYVKNVDINYTTSAKITEGSSFVVTLSNGGAFMGEAEEWKLESNTSGAAGATGLSIENGSKLIMQVDATDMNASHLFSLKFKNNYGMDGIKIKNGAADDITLSVEATTVVGNRTSDVGGARVDNKLILDSVDNVFPSDTLSCTKRTVNSDIGTEFNKDPKTLATCTYTISGMPTMANIDYNTSDLNLTLSLDGIDYAEGNVTMVNSLATSLALTNDGDTVIGKVANDDINDTYNLAFDLTKSGGSPILGSKTLTFTSVVDYNRTTALTPKKVTKQITLQNNVDSIKWELTTYSAEILQVGHNKAVGKNTFITIDNNSNTATKASLIVYPKDGSTAITLADFIDVPAKGSVTTNALAISAAASNQNNFKLNITMPIDATKGDVVAFQALNTGKTIIKVVDNNDDNNGN
ncbi:MAG: hypothetical protein KU28_07950 [Sulfurovum sp. PC08-66]|nr:MAG: hypothetical protein KU28_07950 [Sulfurovum sp. PC08-66]